MSYALKEGAGGKQFPTGRWNRDQGCTTEVVSVGNGAGWAQCSCNYLGPLRENWSDADADADAHEREMFEQRRTLGKRHVRGRFE